MTTDPEKEMMDKIATEYVEARSIINQALREMGIPSERSEHNAAAIIARLSQSGFSLEKHQAT